MNRKERRQLRTEERRKGILPQAPGASQAAAALFARATQALQSGRLNAAEGDFRELLRLDPANAEAHNRLGVVCQQKGDTRAAIDHLKKALALRPKSAEIVNNLGIAQLHLGDLEAAQELFEKAIALNPDFAGAHHNLGLIFKKRRDWDRAIVCFNRAIARAPGDVTAHLNLGDVLCDSGKIEEAIAQYRKAVRIAPRRREAHLNLAAVLNTAMRFEEAVAAARQVLSFDSKDVEAHNLLGSILTTLGRFDEAKASFEVALALKPDYPEALYNLAMASKTVSTPALAARIETLLKTDRSQGQKVLLHFTLGKICDDLRDYAKAFSNYQKGNDLSAPAPPFDASAWETNIAQKIATFTPSYFEKRRSGNDSRRPVFIFGMPRSGTTLVEQIIASHPQTAAGGELAAVRDLAREMVQRHGTEARYPERIASMTEAEAKRFAEGYLAALDKIDRAAARVTDKMPMNFTFLGPLAQLFPNATFIHCRRDPMDTCLSCYFTKLKHQMNFSFSLENLGAYYRGYRRLMEHWRKVLPVSMLEVDYEDLVANQDAVSRKIIAHCGLPWDDRCLAYHETERPVRTASVWQVRQPVYQTSVKRWHHYEQFLGPLRAAIEETDS